MAALDLNTLNFIFLMLGLILHGNSKSFVESVQRGTSTVYGVIIQFPLYAGIFGMISFSGLSEIIAKFFISILDAARPSPGSSSFTRGSSTSSFLPQDPSSSSKPRTSCPLQEALGVSAGDTINAYTAGSLWVNMIQPFWALPILGAFKIKFKDILPYTFMGWSWMFIVMTISFFVLPKIF